MYVYTVFTTFLYDRETTLLEGNIQTSICILECEGDGGALVFGDHYVQPEYLSPQEYTPTRQEGLWEPKRGPGNAKLDFQGEGNTEAGKSLTLFTWF